MRKKSSPDTFADAPWKGDATPSALVFITQVRVVANKVRNGGYAVIGTDGTHEVLLGYADEGTLDPDCVPAPLKEWLDLYARQLALAAQQPGTWRIAAAQQEQVENSYMGRMGKAIEPAVKPLGFNWQMGVSVLTGAAAKEIVVSTMGVLYTGETADEESTSLKQKLQTVTDEQGQHVFNPIVAYSFMLFILLYFPCIAALTAIKREAGTKWMIFEIFYTTAVAWLVSFVFYQTAMLFH